MPNWCMNEMSVSGTAKELEKFVFATQGLPAQYPPQAWEKNEVKKLEKLCFCFNALVPTPKAVLEMGYDAHDKIPKDTFQLLLAGKMLNLLTDIIGTYRTGVQSGMSTMTILRRKKWDGAKAVQVSCLILIPHGLRLGCGLKRL